MPIESTKTGLHTIKVAAAVISNGPKILIARRRQPAELAGMWEFPGGKLRKGESLANCLKREIREELCLEIEVADLLGVFFHNSPRATMEINFCKACLAGGNILLKEHSAARWVTLEQLPGLEFAPPDGRFVACLLNGSISLDQPLLRQQRK